MTSTAPTYTAEDLISTVYWAALALETRKWGQCYVHAARRAGWTSPDGTHYTVGGFGRSLQSGGHKYKVHAMDPSGKPTSTRDLRDAIKRAKEAHAQLAAWSTVDT